MGSVFAYLLCLLPLLVLCADQKQVYIVRIREQKSLHEIEDTHHSYLLSVKNDEGEAKASRLYSYKYSFNGFAAELTPDEASKLSEIEGVASVYKSDPQKYKLLTTRSWEFVGLPDDGVDPIPNKKNILNKTDYGQDIIVGVVDTGIWPESKSFSDQDMKPGSPSWGGVCQAGIYYDRFHCSNKIIGARYYLKGYEKHYGRLNETLESRSPRDMIGHGTHTASTVAGRQVVNASLMGLAGGTATGGAPLARLAIYKVCWLVPNRENSEENACFEEDILAAIDDAIGDKVDVLSISLGLGSSQPLPIEKDPIAIGALMAVKNNIVVACAAGNAGPAWETVSNYHPWVITVAASSIDRDFLRAVILANGVAVIGRTATPNYELDDQNRTLVYAADVVVPGVDKNLAANCLPGSLAPEKVKGNIVVCMVGTIESRIAQGMEVKRAGGVGLILGNLPVMGDRAVYDTHVLPATEVSSSDVLKIIQYIRSTKNPQAVLFNKTMTMLYGVAPNVTSFSSRGPNPFDPNILKPDIAAPGLNILAAWSEGTSVSGDVFDNRNVTYNLQSGTSMAAPHIAASATLIKALHPDWSSAAIRSAIMTTASTINNHGSSITDEHGNLASPFMMGCGQFRPVEAADPGLIYDASYDDYLHYICNLGGSTEAIDPSYKCPQEPSFNLNYPSLAIRGLTGTAVVNRRVTHVGSVANTVYNFIAKPPKGITVDATPNVLRFQQVGQILSFTLTIRAVAGSEYLKSNYGFGSYSWTSGNLSVVSPMAISLK
ncbi:hypothetical protein Pint_10155 [Pistacia integerrima]|uniref:Uncharacterized protein n=1 Tax=Pistacia integerrima TaxID=434235 RepID=A0ACC0XJT3_9ROSI|nr:hypothetical protein Pint_10155 [Pistacia integerrima]